MSRTGLWSTWIVGLVHAVVACSSESNDNREHPELGGASSLVGGSSGKTSVVVQAGTASSTGGVPAQPSSGVAGNASAVLGGGGGAAGNAATSTGGAGTSNAAGSPGGLAGSGGIPVYTGTSTCAAGTYDHDLEPSTACLAWTVCVPGQRVLSSGSSTQDRSCSECAVGFFSTTDNSAACSIWTECPAGTFVSNTPSKTIDRACADCGVGTFTAASNASQCAPHVPCAAGTVQSSVGTTTSNPTCSPCTAGNYCAGATTPSEPCATGTWDHDHAPATACVAKRSCAANEYVTNEGDTVTDRTCTPACAGMQCGTDHGIACGTCSNGGTCNTETNTCVPPWSLISVDYSDRMMLGANNYGDMCAHLVTEGYQIVWDLVTCCDPGPCSQPINDAQWTTAEFKVGARVMLCHGNNYNICSNVVTISE